MFSKQSPHHSKVEISNVFLAITKPQCIEITRESHLIH